MATAKTAKTTAPKAKTSGTGTVSKNTASPAVDITINNAEENEMLKAQIASMQAQMELLIKQMSAKSEPIIEKKSDKTIKFVNMCRGSLVLRGSQVWFFEKQFDARNFSEREAKTIVSNMENTIRSGIVYIDNADFVKECGLEDSYTYVMGFKELQELFEKDSAYVISAYEMVTDEQKQIIIDTIVNKRSHGIDVDGNVLIQLSRLSGKDLTNIEPLED